MATIANLLVKIGADIENLKKGMTEAQNKVNKTADAFKKAGTAMTVGITAPLIAAGAASFKMASDVEESINKVEVAFQKNADEVQHGQKPPCHQSGLHKARHWIWPLWRYGTSMGKSTKKPPKCQSKWSISQVIWPHSKI